MLQRNQIIVTKIILFYSIFVLVMKGIFLLDQYFSDQNLSEALVFAHLILSIPFVLLGIFGFFSVKKENYSWIYVAIGVIIIITMRIYEIDLIKYLRELFS